MPFDFVWNGTSGASAGDVNDDKNWDANLAGSQVRRFLILHKELDADDGELTRNRKVRRSHVTDKYDVLIDALYSDKKSCFVETQVVFEDGRTGSISGNLEIRDVDAAPAEYKKAS